MAAHLSISIKYINSLSDPLPSPLSHSVIFLSIVTLRMLSAKLIEDLNASYTGRMFLSWSASKVIGGNAEDHTFLNTHNLTYNVFTGTSKGIFKHFWQNWKHQKFEVCLYILIFPLWLSEADYLGCGDVYRS
jgi:hypothetical protein